MPYLGVDATLIGTYIIQPLQELVSRELPFFNSPVLTTGRFEAGSAPNIVPGEALIQGTMRTYDEDVQKHLKDRVAEMASHIGQAFRGSAEVEYLTDLAVNYNNYQLTEDFESFLKELADDFPVYEANSVSASEDFSEYSSRVPGVMTMIGVKDESLEEIYPLHNSKGIFNEDNMPVGVAAYAQVAIRYLEENK